MSQFGYDVFGWTNQLYNATDKDIKPPTFKEVATGTAIKEDLSKEEIDRINEIDDQINNQLDFERDYDADAVESKRA